MSQDLISTNLGNPGLFEFKTRFGNGLVHTEYGRWPGASDGMLTRGKKLRAPGFNLGTTDCYRMDLSLFKL